jgi:hypothetical protein
MCIMAPKSYHMLIPKSTSYSFTFSQTYVYQTDEWALPGNLPRGTFFTSSYNMSFSYRCHRVSVQFHYVLDRSWPAVTSGTCFDTNNQRDKKKQRMGANGENSKRNQL